MKKRLFAGILASAVLGAVFTLPAAASCRDSGSCFHHGKTAQKHAEKRTHSTKKLVKNKAGTKVASKSTTRKHRTHVASGPHHSTPGQGGPVVAMIKAMAPAHGVPTWFALRIAKVESGYNPRLRGKAGEYGVFQMKCATAKGIGFRGNCSALLDPRINIQYGLKHLALALKSAGGNLRLAASKHNGGLGRKTEVRGYVALVF